MIEELSEDEINNILANYERNVDGYSWTYTNRPLIDPVQSLGVKGIYDIDYENKFMKFTELGLEIARVLYL